MKVIAKIAKSIAKDMEKEFVTITGAIQAGTKEAAEGLKTDLRQQVTSAGMGTKLANAWRSKVYDNKGYNPAGLVYTRAPKIIEAFDKGVLIKPKAGGVWLAIRDTESVFRDVSDAMANIENPTERVRLAFELFGKQGVALVGMLSEGSDGIDKMRQRARDTDADQQARFPNDKGLEYVPSLQEIDIPWGRAKD